MACVICPGIHRYIYILYQTPVCHGAWMGTDCISMSPGHELIPVHGMRDMSLGHIDTFTFCIKTPVCHSASMEIDYISMATGHEYVPVRGMRDMSLGHIDTFSLCIKTLRMFCHLNGDWLYFHVPGTWISSCSWHTWYVPGTYRHIYILYQNPPYVMEPGWRVKIVPWPRDMN